MVLDTRALMRRQVSGSWREYRDSVPYTGQVSRMHRRNLCTLEGWGYVCATFRRPATGLVFTEVRQGSEIMLDVATEGEVDAFVKALMGDRGSCARLAALFRSYRSPELRAFLATMRHVIGTCGSAVEAETVRRYCALAELIELRIEEVEGCAVSPR